MAYNLNLCLENENKLKISETLVSNESFILPYINNKMLLG